MCISQGAADARFSLTGTLRPIPEAEQKAAAELYLRKHPDAYWVTFGDFAWCGPFFLFHCCTLPYI